jgi:hypothetical protein
MVLQRSAPVVELTFRAVALNFSRLFLASLAVADRSRDTSLISDEL